MTLHRNITRHAVQQDLVINRRGVYSLNPGIPVWEDAAEFERLLADAARLSEQARAQALADAVALYAGPYLQGMDAFWWLETTGRLARTIDEVPDPEAARREASLQHVGRDGEIDLPALQRSGVRLTGRLRGIEGAVATLGDNLADSVSDADRRMSAFLDSIDAYVERTGLTAEIWPSARPAPVRVSPSPDRLDLRAEGIGTVVLATGYRPDHSFVQLPVKDAAGRIRQYRGVTDAPGLYVVGQRFQHRRDSGFIHGARYDAHAVVTHLTTGALPPEPHRAVTSEESA